MCEFISGTATMTVLCCQVTMKTKKSGWKTWNARNGKWKYGRKYYYSKEINCQAGSEAYDLAVWGGMWANVCTYICM